MGLKFCISKEALYGGALSVSKGSHFESFSLDQLRDPGLLIGSGSFEPVQTKVFHAGREIHFFFLHFFRPLAFVYSERIKEGANENIGRLETGMPNLNRTSGVILTSFGGHKNF